MRRDMDLIRALMLNLEACTVPRNGAITMRADDERIAVAGYDEVQITYHLRLIIDAGFVDGGTFSTMMGPGFRGFTWEGHDFIDSVRDPDVWRKTKMTLNDVGGFSLDIVKALAKGFLKKKIAQHTGIEIT